MMQSSLRKPAVASAAPRVEKPQSPAKTSAKPKPAKPVARAKQGKLLLKKKVRKLALGKGKAHSRRRRVGSKRRTPIVSKPQLEQGDESFRERQRSYEQGYQEGLIEGGERMLEEHLPPDMIIPDITAREAVSAGVESLKKRGIPLLNSATVYDELAAALNERRSYAFIRLGDGELLTLAQEKVLSLEEVRREGDFLPYAGVTIPNLAARDELAECIKVATLIGVPMSRHPHFQPLLFATLRAHGIDYRQLRFTTSTMNYLMEEQGLLLRLFQGRKLLIIGNVALQLREALLEKGMEVVGAVTPVNGYADVPRVVAEAMQYDYDIALVAAGIAAIPITVHLAGMGGKVTFDFGHLADRMAGLAQPERQ